MRSKGKRYFENQTTVVYGGGAVLVDLNTDEPKPDLDWLRLMLTAEDVACEFPACDAYAITVLKIPKHYPYLCREHHTMCTGKFGADARRILKCALVDDILETSFGLPQQAQDDIAAEPLHLAPRKFQMMAFVAPEFGQL